MDSTTYVTNTGILWWYVDGCLAVWNKEGIFLGHMGDHFFLFSSAGLGIGRLGVDRGVLLTGVKK